MLTVSVGCDTIVSMSTPAATLELPRRAPSTIGALRRGWRALGDDPVRLLGASAVVLALDLSVGWAVWQQLLDPSVGPSLLALALLMRVLVGGPAELVSLAWAAEALDGRVRSTGALLRAMPFWLLERIIGLAGGLLLALPGAALALVLATSGALPAALLAGGLAAVGFLLGQSGGRAPLAMVPLRILAADESIRDAWRHSLRPGPVPWAGRALILATASVARGMGTALAVAPALPTAPLSHLALLARLFPEDGCEPSSRA